jgi:uncharacterized protein (TIGR03067 family)
MTRIAAMFAVLVLALGLARAQDKQPKDPPKDKEAPKEAAKESAKELDGTYKIVLAERDGRPAEKATLDAITVTIKGDEFTLTTGPADKATDSKLSKIKATPDAKLSTIDFTPQDGTERGKLFPGIYKLEKGELTVAMSEKGERPKEFKSAEGVVLLRLKKVEK